MRRPFVISIGALALAFLPAAVLALTPAAQDPAAQTPPPAKVPFTSPAGALLVQIKPDQTAIFEELARKIQAGLAKTQDPLLKQQSAGLKIYKAAEPFGANALYVIVAEPAVANAEYELFGLLQRVMTKEELAAPEAKDMWEKYRNAFAAGLSRLSLTPVK